MLIEYAPSQIKIALTLAYTLSSSREYTLLHIAISETM